MNASDRRSGCGIRIQVLSIAAVICAPCVAIAAGSGTIHFAGMIVAKTSDTTAQRLAVVEVRYD
jgi:hypothetical protein